MKFCYEWDKIINWGMINRKRSLLLVLLLPLLLIFGCEKTTVEPNLDDLQLTLEAEVLPNGDVEFIYRELNESDQTLHFARSTSCPIFEVKIYENNILVDNLYNNWVCTSDIPTFTLKSGESNEYEGSWIHNNPTRTGLPPGSYLARLIVTLAVLGEDHDQTDAEFINYTVVETFIVD